LIEVEETSTYTSDGAMGQLTFGILDHDLVFFIGDFNYRIVEGASRPPRPPPHPVGHITSTSTSTGTSTSTAGQSAFVTLLSDHRLFKVYRPRKCLKRWKEGTLRGYARTIRYGDYCATEILFVLPRTNTQKQMEIAHGES
jgi:hypothetical protein